MDITTFWNWASEITTSFGKIGNWLVNPFINAPGLQWVTPLTLLGATGLIAFIGVAVVKWVIS